MLMAVFLVSILAVMGVTQYKDFSLETRNAATRANLQILRNGIAHQFGQSRMRCAQTGPKWPPVESLNNNNVTIGPGGAGIAGGALCDLAQVPNAADRKFVGGSGLPVNPWGGSVGGPSSTVYDCVASGGGTGGSPGPAVGACLVSAKKDCSNGGALAKISDGWCYDPTVGDIWPNSARNDGLDSNTGNENTF